MSTRKHSFSERGDNKNKWGRDTVSACAISSGLAGDNECARLKSGTELDSQLLQSKTSPLHGISSQKPDSRSKLKMAPTFWLMVVGLMLSSADGSFANGDNSMDGMLQLNRLSGREQSGCHRVGHTRRVTIPDCVAFMITTNACRGFCESWAIPSSWESLVKNPGKTITSVGQCCNIMASEDVTVRVMCLGGPRDFTFKSAKTCSCFHCKNE